MGFFDNVKSSLTETSQDLTKKAKDTTEIYRLNNANKTKEKEIEKVIYQIGLRYFDNYREECREKCPELVGRIEQLQMEIAALDTNAKFCVYCGTAINRSEAPAPKMSGKICASCGTPLEEDAAFCTNCGTPVQN